MATSILTTDNMIDRLEIRELLENRVVWRDVSIFGPSWSYPAELAKLDPERDVPCPMLRALAVTVHAMTKPS